MRWQWHQLDHIQIICTSRQITTPAPHHSIFTGSMHLLTPKQQYQSTEGTLSELTNKYVKWNNGSLECAGRCLPLDTWEHLRAKHRVKANETSRSVHSLPAVASISSSSSTSSLMFDLLSRTSAVTVNMANVASSADAANAGRPVTASQAPLPTVTVSSSNDVTLSAVVPPVSHRSARHLRESILHYMPPLTCREAQSRPPCDPRSVQCDHFICLL